ncbi:hypothetical protein ACU635_60845 [[Actinomadura] parvosata]|uniref:hypothetical protein n=1 Tax=[Actinomadura] parvosata TaxID=1955412 RepID=UPI00406C25B4
MDTHPQSITTGLDVLISTYPGWDITSTGQGLKAALIKDRTPQMIAAGVQDVVCRADVPAMAAALADQARRIRNSRGRPAPAVEPPGARGNPAPPSHLQEGPHGWSP